MWTWLSLQILLCSFVSIVSAQATTVSDESVPTALELYRKFIDGNGGHSNIIGLKTLVVTAQMDYVDGDKVEFKLYRKRPGMMRMRLNMPQYYVETAFDGKDGWRQVTSLVTGEAQLEELPESELADLRLDSSIEGPFFTVGRNTANILSIQHDTVREVAAFRVEIAPEAESPYQTIWLSAETFQEVKLSRMVTITEAEQPVVEEIFLSEMDQIEGVHFARKMEYYQDGVLNKTLEVERIRANVGIFDSYFSLK